LPRGLGAGLLSSLREAFVLPGGCAASRRWLVPPQAGLAARRDSSGCDPAVRLGPGTPRCPHETASPTPQPRSARLVPAASGEMAARTRRADGKPATKKHCSHASSSANANGGGGEIHPAGQRSHLAGACGHPTRWPSWGYGAAASRRRRGVTRRAALSGRTRRRVGGLGSTPSPSDRSWPAGQKKPRSEEQ
jgi:hypothetical protein